MPVRRIVRYYRNPGIDASQLRVVRDITNQDWLHWATHEWDYVLHYSNETLHVSKADDIPAISADHGATTTHFCFFKSRTGRRLEIDATNPTFVRVSVQEKNDEHGRPRDPSYLIDAVEKALSLQRIDTLVRTVFVAHGFDDRAQSYANEVKYFLQLNGVTVYSGRSFASESVSNKVKGRMARGDVLIAIVTPQEDNTWVTQEVARADALKKTPIILKEVNAPFKAGILGDREYFTFAEGQVSETFIPILEASRIAWRTAAEIRPSNH